MIIAVYYEENPAGRRRLVNGRHSLITIYMRIAHIKCVSVVYCTSE